MKNKSATITLSIERISWFLLSIFFVILFFRPVETGDIWWHLKAGEYIFQHKTVPSIDPFPFAQEQSVWILTQWLGSLIYYLVYHGFGLLGLKLFRLLLFGTVIGMFIQYARRQLPRAGVLFLVFILIMALYNRPHLRPFVFNFIFIQIFLSALFAFSANKQFKSFIPILIAGPFWVNIHLGSFMYGLSLIGIFLFSAAVKYLKAKPTDSEPNRETKRLMAGFGTIFIIFLFMFLMNPYGLSGAFHPFKTLFFPDYLNFNLLKNTISELQPPQLFTLDYIWFWPILILSIITIYFDSVQRFRNLVLILCSFFIFLYGQRAGLFFVFVVLYTFMDSLKNSGTKQFKLVRTGKNIFLIGLCGYLAIRIQAESQKKVFVNNKIYSPWTLSEDYTAPRALIDKLQSQNIQGAVFNEDTYGGYLLWDNYPKLPPYSDTRQISLNNFKFYNLILRNPAKYWPQIDSVNNFTAVMMDADQFINRKVILFLLMHPDWSLVLVKGDQILFIKKSVSSEDYQQKLLSENINIQKYISILNKTLSSPPTDYIKYVYMEPVATAVTLYELGFKGAALKHLVDSFEISNSPYQHEMARLVLNNLLFVKE